MEENSSKGHFIESIIQNDIDSNKNDGKVKTRFPPEPNGYLHIGHAKSMCLNFDMAETFGGTCNLRFDDSDPAKEEQKYIDSIISNVEWLGFDYGGAPLFASNYFDRLYDYAEQLIQSGDAYVCSLSGDEIREYRGTLTEPGRESPYRNRSVEENLDLFRRMRAGEFNEGAHVLRAKIDMASPNINMRDPVLYRVKKMPHPMTKDKWPIYPMYDFTHCLSDAIEGITHSLCTLEFEDHRPLYDWILDQAGTACHPQQIEFARMNINFTVLSKRKLRKLVEEGHVSGWNDPRMPTLEGMRRRGFTPEAVKSFCRKVGISKKESRIDYGLLEHAVREDLNERAPRRMGVLNPLPVEIENYPEGETEMLTALNHPQKPEMDTREISFSRRIWIERDDFMEAPVKKFFRLAPGREVRLRFAYFITCRQVLRDENGEIEKLICTYDPQTKGGAAPDGRKVKGTLHWVDAADCIRARVKLYDRLFQTANPEEGGRNFLDNINPDSLRVLDNCRLENNLAEARIGEPFQFERLGYFCLDPETAEENRPVFNRTATLRDTWGKILKQQQAGR